MHHHLDEWWENVQRRLAVKRKKSSDELIHQIIYNEWTKKNIQKYKTNFTLNHVFKKKSESHYHTYCKAQTAQETHQIILFWYVEIAEDHETLNISESETWSQLSAAHHDLVSGLSSSSLIIICLTLSYSFSAAVQLIDLSSISDMLLDHVHWINLIVMSHLHDLLSDNNAVRNAYLCNWTITDKLLKLNEKK
jgi:hypothetical protein